MVSFRQKDFENGNIFGNIDFILLAIRIFSLLLNFVSLTIKKGSVS